jgi:hypothetical protein
MIMSEPDAPLTAIQIAVQRLAKLTPIELDQKLKQEAEELGCLKSTLRAEVEKERARQNPKADELQGQSVEVVERMPWNEKVKGAAVLDALVAVIRKHVVLSTPAVVSIALWILASYSFDEFFIFPRLRIRSPVKGCGKSTLLDVMECLVNRPFLVGGTSAAPLFRLIEAKHPTMLLDESDTYLKDNPDLHNICNNGHKKNGQVLRCEGEKLESRAFSVWAPMAIAGIGTLKGTIEDRSIHVRLQKKKPTETVSRFRADRPGKAIEEIACKAARWAQDHGIALGNADPVIPTSVFNRDADNWRPLLAVADLAGDGWPDKARAAAIMTADVAEDDEARLQVLDDIKAIFEAPLHAGDKAIFSANLVAELLNLEGSRWAEYNYGKGLSQNGLSRLLSEYGIHAQQMRIGEEKKRGYFITDFDEAFASYLSPPAHPGVIQVIQVVQPSNISGIRQKATGTEESAVPLENGENASKVNNVPLVPVDFTPLRGVGRGVDDAETCSPTAGDPQGGDGDAQGSGPEASQEGSGDDGVSARGGEERTIQGLRGHPHPAGTTGGSSAVKATQPTSESLQDRGDLSQPFKVPPRSSPGGAHTHRSHGGGVCIHCADCDGKTVPCRHPMARGFDIHHECFRVWLRDGCQPHPTLQAVWEARDPARKSEKDDPSRIVQGLPPAAGTGTLG